MNAQSTTYRDLQVEFSSGSYGGLSFACAFSYLVMDHWIYTALMYTVVGYIFYRDKPLRFLLSLKAIYSAILIFLFFVSSVAPLLILSLFRSNISDLIGRLLIPIGSVSIFIFLWIFYTHERLQKNGWTNVSGRFN
mgnify:CR=1 FL=1